MKICMVDNGGMIPATKYGGTERVIWGLGKELHKLGHELSFLVPKGSYSNFAKVVFYDPEKSIEAQIPAGVDLVHMHFLPKKPLSLPWILTMHGNPVTNNRIYKNTVFISKNQAQRFNSNTFVYNGLSWKDYPKPDLSLPRKGFHFLGKASWKVKNAIGAINMAVKAETELHVLGGKKWSERNIKNGWKHLLNKKIKFHGFVDDQEKIGVMQQSKALIFPVLWHEPFGLAIIESLYAGCAVFGTKNGSLEELVTSEVGFTSNSSSEIIKAMKNFDYNPQKCHNYAVENFNSKRMALEYVELYKNVLQGNPLNENEPSYNNELNTIPSFS